MLRGMGIPDFDFQLPRKQKFTEGIPLGSDNNIPSDNPLPSRNIAQTSFRLPGLSPPTNTQPSRFSRIMQSPITQGIANAISRPPQTNNYTGNIRSRLRGMGRPKFNY